ncbi:MAG: calcium-translocating P-type ATPase, SERCA-type [Clostridiales bacterium]|nr:calcium-translocating P-type ATPase, SERCA-type [Clostridiales bacterium]
MSNVFWHTKSQEEIENLLETSIEKGLTEEIVAKRLEEHGTNELDHQEGRSLWAMIVDQFKDFMVIILIVAALISGLLGEATDAIIILVIVLLNAFLGVIQENKAEESLAALKKMAAPHAKVRRNGRPGLIDASKLVPGDVVILETGDFVPADMRLIETSNLKIEEAALTGESVPVEKDHGLLEEDDIPLGDRINMAYSSSIVTYGRGIGIVVETGMSTQMGRIARMIQSEEGMKTPLQKRMESLGKLLALAALGICALIFIVGVLYGKDIFTMFFTSVSLAVAAIPEGLPAIVTIVLALGVQRMAKRNAIIRKLPAVETLGSATVICSDKTGTLTQNKMTVKQLYYNHEFKDASSGSHKVDDHLQLLMTTSILCNDTQIKDDSQGPKTIGDPTETALVDLGLNYGMDKRSMDNDFKRVYEIPFDSERKLMSTVHRVNSGFRVFTKGATDELLDRCNGILLNGKVEELTQEHIEDIKKANETMASKALRVLSMAYKDIDEIPSKESEGELENNLIFVGILGMIDPPREEAKEAVKLCKRAGIKPVMITGDHKITAVAIAKELGILEEGDEAVTGVEIEAMGDEELKERIRHISVYARVAPEHKVRIVKGWQKWGQIVAMTGDGVNDAPALKRADIGAAMGIVGTDVAKEAADMVLTDDNFSTVVAAVEEGRIIFSNILKSIQFLLSCNVGEIMLLFIATMLNWEAPLLPIHILWVNLVTDSLPALALGVDPAEKGIMDQRPRDPSRGIFDRALIAKILYQGVMVGLLALIAFVIGNRIDVTTGRTMSFAVLALSQLSHVFNVRSNTKSAFQVGFFTNKKLLGAVAFSALLQISVITLPSLSDIFKVKALGGQQWLIVAALSIAPLLIVEVIKAITRKI